MSKIEVDKIDPQSGTDLELGTSGDTITIPAGVTFDSSAATNTLPSTVVTTTGTQTLTNKTIGSSQLTGALPAIDGSALTGISVVGNYVILDSITTSATTTFALTSGGAAFSPASANQCIVSLNGVIQAPISSFTISGSNIVFASALTVTDVIDFIQVLGNVLDVGTPTDGTVTTAKIADGAVTSAKLASGVGGKVLQVVSATTATTASSTSSTYADTGLTASITPSSTSNKILVLIQQNGVAKQSANTAVNIKILRDSTEIGGTDAGKNIGYTSSTAHNFVGNGLSCSVLDTPSSTSALTYKTQFHNSNASGTVYVQADSGSSYITLMEISA